MAWNRTAWPSMAQHDILKLMCPAHYDHKSSFIKVSDLSNSFNLACLMFQHGPTCAQDGCMMGPHEYGSYIGRLPQSLRFAFMIQAHVCNMLLMKGTAYMYC